MTHVVVGQKGQVTLKKKLREIFDIIPGILVEEVPTEEGILIKPVQNPLKRWKKLAGKVSKKWPSDVSAVTAVKEDRTK